MAGPESEGAVAASGGAALPDGAPLPWQAADAAYYPRERCIHRLFERQVVRCPDATALVYRDQRLSYGELNRRANQLARYLRRFGVATDSLVGICMHRSVELVVAILGVLKAGGTYVPLDASYPKKRLAGMFDDIDMRLLLVQHNLLFSLPKHEIVTVCVDSQWPAIARESDEDLRSEVSAFNLAYVIFTSGSTGKPKAAAVYHRGWTNLMTWFATEFKIGRADRVLVVSSFSFDITQRSIVMALITGGELHLLGSDSFDPALVCKTIAERRITLMNCAPSMFYLLIEDADRATFEKLRPLRVLFLGGEPISGPRLRQWAEACARSTEVVNVYGIAECSDVSSFYRLTDYERYVGSSVPIGKPIANTQIHLLDESLMPVPAGAAGEICIAGDGVGKGYINDRDSTERRFVRNPFGEDSLLYRTGDRGRLLPDGNLEFIGRVDYQIKVQGQRIDLGDIETTLRQHAAVTEAVVLSREYGSGDQRLVAYVVLRQRGQSSDMVPKLRSFLKERLPQYMVPAEFVLLDKMPLNPNGKIDRGALRDGHPKTAPPTSE